nr:unnamed protein product [Callosobruchus chinensis]
MAVVNCRLLDRRAGKFDMPLLDTKVAIADALCKARQSAELNKDTQTQVLSKCTKIKEKKDQQKKSPKQIFERLGSINYFNGRRQTDVNTSAA